MSTSGEVRSERVKGRAADPAALILTSPCTWTSTIHLQAHQSAFHTTPETLLVYRKAFLTAQMNLGTNTKVDQLNHRPGFPSDALFPVPL